MFPISKSAQQNKMQNEVVRNTLAQTTQSSKVKFLYRYRIDTLSCEQQATATDSIGGNLSAKAYEQVQSKYLLSLLKSAIAIYKTRYSCLF